MGALLNDKKIYQQVTAATAQAQAGATDFQENMEALKHNFLLRGFFKKRGYEDSDEIAKHQISRLPPEQNAKTFEYDGRQIFRQARHCRAQKRQDAERGWYFSRGKLRSVLRWW